MDNSLGGVPVQTGSLFHYYIIRFFQSPYSKNYRNSNLPLNTPILYYYIIIFFLSSYSENYRNSSLFPPTTPNFHYYSILLSDSYMVYLPYVTEPPPPTPHYYIIRFFHSSYLENYIIISLYSFIAHIR